VDKLTCLGFSMLSKTPLSTPMTKTSRTALPCLAHYSVRFAAKRCVGSEIWVRFLAVLPRAKRGYGDASSAISSLRTMTNKFKPSTLVDALMACECCCSMCGLGGFGVHE
jgi:hypothetical protein